MVTNPVNGVMFPVGGVVSVDAPVTLSVSPVNTVMLPARASSPGIKSNNPARTSNGVAFIVVLLLQMV
jgi:hypothetical protein